MIVIAIVYLAIVVLMIASLWKIFVKAGQPGWAAIVPIYNLYIMTQIAGKPGWWTILLLIPYVNIVFGIWCWNLICKKFGKDTGFLIGIILLGIVFLPILAFGDAQYQGATNTSGSDGVLDSGEAKA